MTTSRRSDPLSEALTLRDAMNQLFAQSFVNPGWNLSRSQALAAPVDVFETGQGYQVRVLLAGMKPDDIDLTVQGTTLTVKGQVPSPVSQGQQVNWLVQEIGSGPFERTITFPKPIAAEQITTHYQDGILSITVPLHEVNRPRRISITSSQPRQQTVEAGAS